MEEPLAGTADNPVAAVSPSVRQLTFTCGVSSGDGDSKTTLSGNNHILWTKGEQISVIYGTTDKLFSQTDKKTNSESAEFTGSVSSSASKFYLIYPYKNFLTVDSNGTISGMSLPQTQTPNFRSFDPSASIMCGYSADLKDDCIQFNHYSSYLKLTPGFNCSKISVTSINGEPLAGSFWLTVGTDGKAKSRITLNPSSTVSLEGSIKKDSTYVLCLLPGVLKNGFHVVFTSEYGVERTRTKWDEVTLTSGHMKNLGSFAKDGDWDIKLSRTSIGLLRGKEFNLSATASSSLAGAALRWSSSNESVASVSSSGKITALKPGSSIITVEASGAKATCYVTVVSTSDDVFRYGYNELNDNQKKAYEYMLEQVLAFEDNSKTYSDIANRVYLDFSKAGYYPESTDEINRLTNLLIKDVPEAYPIVNYVYRYDYSAGQYYIRLEPTLYFNEAYGYQMMKIYQARDQLLSGLEGKSEFEKALAIHDRFIDYADYGGMTRPQAGNIVGGLVEKKAVCEGNARTYLFLCQQAGLKSIYVCGSKETSSTSGSWVNHAWNDVKIADVWYMTDVTEDGGLIGAATSHKYFLIGQNKFDEIHKYLDVYGSDQNKFNGYSALPSLPAESYPMER